ncbi:MAG TPA: TMEM175 family protein, partial [Candidatus Binatus sp.]|nr:TMEM175 family protein [Candidatus Binatus sp.]
MTSEKQIFIPRSRLEMFSDLIFGLSLSISAVTLIGSQVFTVPNIVNRIIAFVFNFVVLIMIWLRYTGTMAILPIETGQVIFLNLFLLLLVGLEPFLLIL